MATRSDLQEELRKKQLQARVQHERGCSKQERELKYESERLSNAQEKLRKQQQRLEQEKLHYKGNSFLTKDRRLSPSDDKLPQLATDGQSKSAPSPDYSEVKSKLFEYKKYTPRSRRQLMQSTDGSPAISPVAPRAPAPDNTDVKSKLFGYKESSPRSSLQLIMQGTEGSPAISVGPPRVPVPKPSHAFEASKASYTEFVKNAARLPHGKQASADNVAKTSLPGKGLEKTPSSGQNMHSENKVSFKDEMITIEVPSPSPRVRRGSLQSSRGESLLSPYPQSRRASLPASTFQSPDLPTQPSQRRRHSLPAKPSSWPKIRNVFVPEHSNANERRLAKLYNKAIETVQLADEALLTIDRSFQHRLRMRRQSGAGSSSSGGFDLATLKELESILSDARVYSNRKPSKEDYSRLDVSTQRAQRKRIEHLEQILKKLNPSFDTGVDIDPVKVLQCSYLRLSKSNVETLENMIREDGKDPGIHIHSDVTNLDIWKGLKEERTDLKKPEVDQEKRPHQQTKSLHL